MTMGEILFYGGIIGTVVFAALFVTSWIIFERKKKKLIQKIEEEYG